MRIQRISRALSPGWSLGVRSTTILSSKLHDTYQASFPKYFLVFSPLIFVQGSCEAPQGFAVERKKRLNSPAVAGSTVPRFQPQRPGKESQE